MRLDFCAVCGCKENLHHHHWNPKVLGGSDNENNILTLCGYHHREIHGHKKNIYYKTLQKKGIEKTKEKHPEKYSGRKTGAYTVNASAILDLRSQKYSYDIIAKKLKIGKSTVQNHCRQKIVDDLNKFSNKIAKKIQLNGEFDFQFSFNNAEAFGFFKLNGGRIKIGKTSTNKILKKISALYKNYNSPNNDEYDKLATEFIEGWIYNKIEKLNEHK